MAGFAVIQTGWKQYKVSEGSVITIEKLQGEQNKGDKLTFDKVLLTDDGKTSTVGTPMISGAKAVGEVLVAGRAKKIDVIKYKAKSRYFKKRGHRQHFLKVRIEKLS